MMVEKKVYKWITIEKKRSSPSGKTHYFNITSNEEGSFLGVIAWYSKWRKYSVFPANDTIFEEDCLSSIIDFLNILKEERKNGK